MEDVDRATALVCLLTVLHHAAEMRIGASAASALSPHCMKWGRSTCLGKLEGDCFWPVRRLGHKVLDVLDDLEDLTLRLVRRLSVRDRDELQHRKFGHSVSAVHLAPRDGDAQCWLPSLTTVA